MVHPLPQIILKTIPNEAWPAKGQPLVIGISGGPDSVALAMLLHELNGQVKNEWRLHLAHLNHKLRGPESDQDALFVRQLAERQGWGLSIEEAAVQGDGEETLEEAARNARYAFFLRVLDQVQGQVVATAHHADDNAETVLQRILRGTGMRGLAGIPVNRPLGPDGAKRVIRPLIHVRRSRISEYLQEHHLDYRKDLTNEETEFTRNKIRNQLIPLLESQFNPTVRDALIRLIIQSTWVVQLLQDITDEAFEDVHLSDPDLPPPGLVLNAESLKAKPLIIQTEVIRKAIRQLGVGEKRLTFDHVLLICELAAKRVSGKRLALPGYLSVAKQRERLIFTMTGN